MAVKEVGELKEKRYWIEGTSLHKLVLGFARGEAGMEKFCDQIMDDKIELKNGSESNVKHINMIRKHRDQQMKHIKN